MNSKSMIACALALALMLGCATGAALSRLVVPEARAGTNPPKWEYVCGEVYGVEALQKWANQLGGQGWEMAGSAGGMMGSGGDALRNSDEHFVWCFKRLLLGAGSGAKPRP